MQSFSYRFLTLWGNTDSQIDSLVPSAVAPINASLQLCSFVTQKFPLQLVYYRHANSLLANWCN